MSTLIMLCGQGSAGKSTYGTKVYNSLLNDSNTVDFIRVDDYAPREGMDTVENTDEFYNNMAKLIDESTHKNDFTIYDFANDSPVTRKYIIDKLSNKNVDFICVYLYTDLSTFLHRALNRNDDKTVDKETLLWMIDIHDYAPNYFPTEKELIKYGFNSNKIYIIDNSKDISELDVSYLVP